VEGKKVLPKGQDELSQEENRLKLHFCQEHNRWFVHKASTTEKETEKEKEKWIRLQFADDEAFVHKKFRKALKRKQAPSLVFDKAFKMFLILTVTLSVTLRTEAAQTTDIPIALKEQDHYVLFDKVGEMASNMAYIHVTFALNVTTLYDRAEVISKFLISKMNDVGAEKELNKQSTFIHNNQQTGWLAHEYKSGHRPLGKLFQNLIKVAWDKLDLVTSDILQLVQRLPTVDFEKARVPARIKNLSNKAKNFGLKRPEVEFKTGRAKRYTKTIIHHKPVPVNISQLYPPVIKLTSCSQFLELNEDFPTILDSNMGFFFDTVGLDPDQQREKRFAPLLAAGGAILGTFLGLFNQYEMSKLQNRINDIKTTSDVLVQITNQHDVELKVLQEEIAALSTVVTKLIWDAPEVLSSSLDFAIMELKHQVDKVNRAYQMLQFHRLSSDLVNGNQLQEMHLRLKIMAQKNGCELLPKITSDYFQLETSYIRQQDDIMVVVHVPCVSIRNSLTIYRYVPYPFPLPIDHGNVRNTTIGEVFDPSLRHKLTRTTITKLPEALFIKPETTFLAIGNDQQYKLLSEAEFGLCTKKSNYYLCEEHQVLRIDPGDTCLGSLYLRDQAGVQQHCHFERRPLQEMVYQLSPTDHLVYSPELLTTQIKCRNNSHFPLFLEKHTRISIPEGCQTKLRRHIITSDVTLRENPEPLQVKWEWNPLSFPSDLLQDVGMVDEQIGRLEQHIEYMRNFTLDPRHIKPVAEEVLRERHMFSWTWYVVIGIIVGLILLVGIGACLTYFRRKRLLTLWNILSRRGNTPPPRGDEDIEQRQPFRPHDQELPILRRHVNREHDCASFPAGTPRPSRPRSGNVRYSAGTPSELQFGMDDTDDDHSRHDVRGDRP